MALHLTPEEHDANPPHTWEVIKHPGGRRWKLQQKGAEYPIATFNSKREAVKAKSSGQYVELYEKEGRWFSGKPVPGWKSYERAVAERSK